MFNKKDIKKDTDIQENNSSFKLNDIEVAKGINSASYFSGFALGLQTAGLSEETISDLVLSKLQLEYEREMLAMKIGSDEYVAALYKKMMLEKEDL